MLTQAREDLIERTVESLVGATRATVHLYNATAPLFRARRLRRRQDEHPHIAVRGTEMVMKYAEERCLAGTDFGYQYSPEIFTGTELDFALEVCEAVSDVWQPEAGRRDHPQPARHGRDVDAQHLRRPDRVVRPQPDPPRARRRSACTRTTTAVRRSPRPSWR